MEHSTLFSSRVCLPAGPGAENVPKFRNPKAYAPSPDPPLPPVSDTQPVCRHQYRRQHMPAVRPRTPGTHEALGELVVSSPPAAPVCAHDAHFRTR